VKLASVPRDQLVREVIGVSLWRASETIRPITYLYVGAKLS
jgi:hypothetical protein